MELLIYTVIISFVLSLVVGTIAIPMLRKLKLGQQVRDDGPKTHLKKAGTPTMGGIIFLLPLSLVSLMLSKGSLDFVLAAVLVTLGFGLIGFIDDYIKVAMQRSLGLRAYQKLIFQIAISVLFAYYAYRHVGSEIIVPFTGKLWNMGVLYIPFTAFVMVSMVNSVNLTDGLDGLASGVSLIIAATFSIIAAFLVFWLRNQGQEYLAVNYSNLMVFAGALTGACLGFLRFNTYPAQIFMGDTGSLGLGGAIAAVAILLKSSLFIPILGGVYVAEAVSVIMQVVSFKLTGKRIFRMSPLHHHFELGGMTETKVVTMFMIVTVLLCLIGLLGM